MSSLMSYSGQEAIALAHSQRRQMLEHKSGEGI
jgi:hypothetical protein